MNAFKSLTESPAQHLVNPIHAKAFHQHVVDKNDLTLVVENTENVGERTKNIVQKREMVQFGFTLQDLRYRRSFPGGKFGIHQLVQNVDAIKIVCLSEDGESI